jgi:hypothetical protein
MKELVARRIRMAIDSLNQLSVLDKNIYLDKIRCLINESKEEDDLYDKETSHGSNISEQIRWQKLISNELIKLNFYSIEYEDE